MIQAAALTNDLTDMALSVDDAVASDLAEIIELDAGITGVARPDFWTDFFQQKAVSTTLCVLIARKSGRIAGYAIGDVRAWPVRSQSCGWLYAIGVKPEYRLSRAATALMSALLARFKAHGVTTVRTMIDIDDHLLMSFLRSQGMSAGPFIELEMKIDT